MNQNLRSFCIDLEKSIQAAYESSVTMDEAERLAAKFLHGQLYVSKELRDQDLDARMKKAGLKAIKASVYMHEATKSEKKPVEAMLASMVDTNEMVQSAQKELDLAEVDRDLMKNYFDIFTNAHIHFRSVSKGSYGG